MTDDLSLVLLHGAGTGAWVWDRVIRQVPASAIALDVQGRTAEATPESCVQAIISELDGRELDDVVLVLHSLAGVLAPGFTRRLGSRLRQIVFVSGVIPPAGGAFVDALGFSNRMILKLFFRFNREGLKPSAAMIRRELCNDLTEEDAERIVSRYEAEMPGLYLTPVEEAPLPAGCAYVKLLKDRSVAPKRQDTMIARLRTPVVHEIDSGHLVMLSQPAELAEVLNRETRRLARQDRSTETS